jgi:hypothetical protein
MKRLRRIIFNGLTALSLLLYGATCILWVRSYWVSDFLAYERWTASELRWFDCHCGRGGFGLTRGWIIGSLPPAEVAGEQWGSAHSYPEYPTAQGRVISWKGLGFSAWASPLPYGDVCVVPPYRDGGETGVVLPAWFPAAVFAVLPLRWLIVAWRKQHRNRTGNCIACGYDLTGNVSARCPECGTLVAVKKDMTAA